MKTLISKPLWLFAAISLYGSQLHAATGEETAKALTALYNDTRADCGKPSMPAFLCSGVMLRGTTPSTAFHAWDPSPKSIENGGISFSYLRADTKYNTLAYGYTNGFFLYPPFAAPDDKDKIQVLCSFPMDAASEHRDEQGCGRNSYDAASKEVSQRCELQSVFTAEQWVEKFERDGFQKNKSCSFDVRDERNEKAGPAFYESVKASMGKNISFEQNNELRLETWPTGKGASLPIWAFFYLNNGLAGAQDDQKDFMKTTGQFVPIIQLVLPADASKDAQFLYSINDQAVTQATATCDAYIQSATWARQIATGTQPPREEWALSVTPTPCGREAKQEQTEAMFQELRKLRGDDTQWKDEEKSAGSMRRQMVCLLVNYRENPTWSLEPFRPYVTHDEATAAHCNPVVDSTTTPVSETEKCTAYIQSAGWVNRYDPGKGQNEWTLAVRPTACGRSIHADQTDALYQELVSKYGQDSQWTENDKGGMRRQTVCHLVIAREKDTWNLEPFRPNVSHEVSLNAGCNPI
ncbi:DUF2599 domain-containing protein [Pseudomonas donghuensis]|uniref:DUF2599 domain-containing protein n=1 Tax=Pseudomonas donghuensis TaxID=1163398 RepID=UPI000C2A6580|nr:DUF2599 domain-containing protein [Pseudomonas donghuensis]PJY94521.1 halovibrin [Pseudomonas donghuensis]WKY26097.1 DUF2599 domain-containing protein [Pseudomonas donghuensis]